MYLGPFKLHDIINTGKKVRLEVTTISFDPDDKLYLLFSSEQYPDETATVDSCREHNDKQVSSINQSIGEVRDFLSANPDSTKRKNQLVYLSNTLDHFVNWYKENKLYFPDSDRHFQLLERKPKYQVYQELFNGFLSDHNANPDKVKSALNNKAYFKNPSTYLAQARKKAGLTVAELKALPGFTWIDPKGTAKD